MIHRIIGKLDIKGPNLVKGIHLEGLRVMGKPEDFARYYYENGIDELVYMDVVASLYNRNSLKDIIAKTAKEIFIPLTVGGGLRSIEDIKEVLRSGADKVSLNTIAIKNPNLIKKASKMFGSSTITISIEVIREPDDRYLAYTNNGRECTGIEAIGWAREVEKLGAGEIFLTSIDREGTGNGFDLELIEQVTEAVSIPVIACGGAGSTRDIEAAFKTGKADAVAVASLLHYEFLKKSHRSNRSFQEEGNIEFLKRGHISSKIETASVDKIKKYLKTSGIVCRYNSKSL